METVQQLIDRLSKLNPDDYVQLNVVHVIDIVTKPQEKPKE